METFPFVFVALLVLCVIPSALALECEVCTNLPTFPGAKTCDKPGTLTCPFGFDRCMTVDGKIGIENAGSLDFQLKNCSNSFLICPKDGLANLCRVLNTTGLMQSCSLECCEGDMCNEAVRLSAWLASFTSILMALYLNVFN